MRRIFVWLAGMTLLPAMMFISCKNSSPKVKIIGTRGEVYYKDGATIDDAKRVGDFLKGEGYFNPTNAATAEVMKQSDHYTLRLVYDKSYFDSHPTVEAELKEYAAKLSGNVFDGKDVDISLADEYLKDFKKIPFEKVVVKKEEEKPQNPDAPPGEPIAKDEYDHDKLGDVTYYWKGISDKESKFIADYIRQTGEFEGGHSEIYMMKEGDRYILKFPVKPEYRNDQATIDEIGKVSKKIKDNVFPNNVYSFEMTDEHLNTIKTFDY